MGFLSTFFFFSEVCASSAFVKHTHLLMLIMIYDPMIYNDHLEIQRGKLDHKLRVFGHANGERRSKQSKTRGRYFSKYGKEVPRQKPKPPRTVTDIPGATWLVVNGAIDDVP